jgi:hypothetical protein
MAQYADLEISIRKLAEKSFAVAFRFDGPADEAEETSPNDLRVTFDPSSIRDFDPAEYGARLGAAFFTPDVKAQFILFRAKAQGQMAALRVRLFIDPSAPELHALHWETLRDPELPDAPLFMGETTIVSRFLASGQDSRPIRLHAQSDLTALVVVANPSGFKLAPVDVAKELSDATAAMSPESSKTKIAITALAPGGQVRLNDIVAQLAHDFDILYIVCHGQIAGDEPYLYLEEGERPVMGAELVQRIRELGKRPRLVVLASCQSGGKGGVGMAGLGPRLANAGVPAVVAMQGSIQMDTADAFMRCFFAELLADGQIDRAMSVARGAVREKDDCWMPVLFLRLRAGRIWYVPGFQGDTGQDKSFEQWNSICNFVRKGECVPILGPDVAEHIFGLTKTLAAEIAEAENFPLESRDQYDLAKVAQYLTIHDSPQYAKDRIKDAYGARLDKAGERILQKSSDDMQTADLYDAIAAQAAPCDPLRIVAGLNAGVFINASNDVLFESYLREAEVGGKPKQPVPLVAEWRDERFNEQAAQQFMGDPAPDRPYVYYVFGKRKDEPGKPPTWVLTEDDFFDYLIRTTRFKLMPGVVSDALVTGSLLFLGFPLDDWKFRVLFRLILAKGGSQLLSGFNHVGVQVDPSETTLANARMARRYLQSYFKNSKIDIYWGTAADFLRDLKAQLDKAPAAMAARRRD